MCITCIQQGLDAFKQHNIDPNSKKWDSVTGRWVPLQTNQTKPPDPQQAFPAVMPSPGLPAPTSGSQGNITLPKGGGWGQLPPSGLGPGQGPTPVTKVNASGDPRVVWEDGFVAIIYAKDFPANAGMGRSKTRKDIADAIKATIDDALQTAPGGGVQHDFVKVWLKELLARPLPAGAAPKVQARLPIDPSQFKPVKPVIAQSGAYKGQIIPDFPHNCASCGGKYYQGMFSGVHDTPDGKCPNESKGESKFKRRR